MAYTWLADALRAEGCRVVEVDGWETRRASNSTFRPIGVVVHHTAPPVPYPIDGLLRKCNLNVKTDGTVYVVSAGYQYDTGDGSYRVRDETAAGIPPPARAYTRGLYDDGTVNPYYFDIETDHPGDGSPIPDVQRDAVIKAAAAICRQMGWTDGHVIGHSESTPRKVDPRWNGTYDDMQNIRPAVREQLGLEPKPLPEEAKAMYPIYRVDKMQPGEAEARKEDVKWVQMRLQLLGYDIELDGVSSQATLNAVFELVDPITGTSPQGGSYISGKEAAAFDVVLAQSYAGNADLSAYAKKFWVKKNYVAAGEAVAITPLEGVE